ncbi:MAG: hypothetical protein KJO35_09145 [Gammaproteobacteria bacterium]|nr:hypothetical protein [Gammaproteobacteria bacterium]
MRALISTLTLAALTTVPAIAADLPGKSSFALRASTLGFGAEFAHTLPIANLTGRINWNGYNHEMNDTIEGIPYKAELDLSSVSALLDWRPWGQLTHLSVGLVFNGNEVNAVGDATGSYTIGDMSFAASDVGNLVANASFDEVAPYAGLGWNFTIMPNTALALEVGVVFQGSPKVTFVADGPLASDPTFQSELLAEQSQFQNDVDDLKYYPVIALGLLRRF